MDATLSAQHSSNTCTASQLHHPADPCPQYPTSDAGTPQPRLYGQHANPKGDASTSARHLQPGNIFQAIPKRLLV